MDPQAVPADLAAALLAAGYRVGGPAGVGGGGPVWTATRARTARSPRRITAEDGVESGPGSPDRFVVHTVPAGTGPVAGARAARVRSLWSLDHPHLARVEDVVDVPAATGGGPEQRAVLFGEVPGATVAALLAARGRLSPGELVTLLVPIAGALDALHRAGLVHGDVSPANIVVRPDGRPVLIDLLGGHDAVGGGPRPVGGTPGFVAPELARSGGPGIEAGDATPEGLPSGAPADVFALAAVGLAALDLAAVDGRLGQELAAACVPDPALRPSAAELAGACYPCAPPEPIAVPDAGVLARAALAQLAAAPRTVSAGGRSRHRARRGSRKAGVLGRHRVVLALAGVLTVVVGTVVLVPPADDGGTGRDVTASSASGDHGTGDPPAVRTERSEAGAAERVPDPVTAAVDLTRRRAEVLGSGDPARLADVSRPGSGAHAADTALLGDLQAAGVRIDGLSAVVEAAEVALEPATGPSGGTVPSAQEPGAEEASARRAQVSVRSGLTAHRRVSPSGTVDVAAQPARTVVLRLVLTGDGWRVEDVVDG